MSEATFAIGIDLGTTHCAIAYVDRDLSEGEDIALSPMKVPQAIAPGEVEPLALLPSFMYVPHGSELAPGSTALPWNPTPSHIVGEIARRLGAQTPDRLVASAKSWLGHHGVDRRTKLLPQHAPDEVARISPVEASIEYLKHLRAAWDATNPREPLHTQDVTLTVPASFDPSARELTAEAAKAAGFERLTLLEEPQAALYSWIQARGSEWRDELNVGDVILVVDVGGGTTDFSLISVSEDDGHLQLQRVAVGDHILLGGDNMDLALAYAVKAKVEANGATLEPWQIKGLTQPCRNAKERILAGDADSVAIVVPSRGRKLIGGTLRAQLTRADVEAVVLEGFFPEVEANAEPNARRRGALTSIGLPYAQDAAVTRHLASFLVRHQGAARPSLVLFNGGVLKSPSIRQRVLRNLERWLGEPPRMLEGADLDGGVARGAAYYGFARDGGGVRIHGGLAQAFYVGIEESMPAVPGLEPEVHALCVAPFGLDEGSELKPLPQEVGLILGEPVRFRFFASSVRRDDEVGTLLRRFGDELTELGAIEARLPGEGSIRARLRARVTELGTLVLEALPADGREPYKVEMDVRQQSEG